MIDFKSVLKERGLKATRARLAILSILAKEHAPKNVENLLEILQKNKNTKRINEATVYRTLNSLVNDQLLKKVDLHQDSAFFEIEGEHHHHIICTKCHKIEEIKSIKLEKFLQEVVEPSCNFNKITEHSLEFFGLCNSCSMKS